MKIEKSTVTLSTGKQFYASADLISISDDLRLFYGYDGNIDTEDDDDKPIFTADEKREIADYMIERWTRFRDEA